MKIDKEKAKARVKVRMRKLIDEFSNGKQQDFADMCGVSKYSISQYVNGQNTPGNVTAALIASKCNVNPMWVMGFDVDRKSDADRFKGFAKAYNKAHTVFLTTHEMELMQTYRKLNTDYRNRVDDLVHKLNDLQQTEASYLTPLAAHESTGIENAPENESHDKALIKDMAKQNNDN